MEFRSPAIVCALRPHGEAGAIVRFLTGQHGLVGAYVAGARGRLLRPVLIPGNLVEVRFHQRSEAQLPSARAELLESRGPWLTEPLAAAAIRWVTALAASTLPERQPYPALFDAQSALLDAICKAPSARGWLPGLLMWEALLLRELGYGGDAPASGMAEMPALMARFDEQGASIGRYLLADRRGDVMGARAMLRERLERIV